MEQQIAMGTMDGRKMSSYTIHPYGCALFVCTDGYARLSVNHRPFVLRRGDLCVCTSDVFLSMVRTSGHFSARYLFLPEAIFNTVYYQITNMSLWEFLLQNPILRLSPQQGKAFGEWLDMADWTIRCTRENVAWETITTMTCSLFRIIDDQLRDWYDNASYVSKDSGWTITVKFFNLLYKHYKEHRNVEFYADQMHISADYLNKVIRRVYGSAPKKFINDQLVEDIKFRLAHTGQSIKEISRQLHFEDTSYFCRFFRKQTGLSPMAFKQAQR